MATALPRWCQRHPSMVCLRCQRFGAIAFQRQPPTRSADRSQPCPLSVHRPYLFRTKTPSTKTTVPYFPAMVKNLPRGGREIPHHAVMEYRIKAGLDGRDNRRAQGPAPRSRPRLFGPLLTPLESQTTIIAKDPRSLHLAIEAKAEDAADSLALTADDKGPSVATGRRANC